MSLYEDALLELKPIADTCELLLWLRDNIEEEKMSEVRKDGEIGKNKRRSIQ